MGPEEEVAAALEKSAIQARARGGYTAETALLTRAADLTPGAGDKARRLLGAAHAAHLAGDSLHAQALLEAADHGDLDELDQARAQMLDGMIRGILGEGRRTPALLLKAAKSLVRLDAELSRRALLGSLNAMLTAYQCADGTTGREIGETALAVLGDGGEESTVDSLIRGVASAFVCEYAEAVPALAFLLATFERMSADEINEWYYVPVF